MKRKINWSPHASYRYMLRFALRDLDKDEIEAEAEKQTFRIYEGYDKEYRSDKYKTIFQVRGIYVTVEKAEYPKSITIITLWESPKEEIELWEKKK